MLKERYGVAARAKAMGRFVAVFPLKRDREGRKMVAPAKLRAGAIARCIMIGAVFVQAIRREQLRRCQYRSGRMRPMRLQNVLCRVQMENLPRQGSENWIALE